MDQPPSSFTRLGRLAMALVVALAVVACGSGDGPAAGGVMSREAFIATYVDLRVAALDNEDLTITDEERAEVLARHGVGAEDLRAFAEVHGTDVEFMSGVWNEIDTRLSAMSPGVQDG